jgi:hypothetical protein
MMRKYFAFFVCLALLLGVSRTATGQVDTEFWFAVPELSFRSGNGGKPGILQISTLELEATVTITMPANAWDPVTNPAGFLKS